LAQFVLALEKTGTLIDSVLQCLRVKFGQSIDQDELGTTWEEVVDGIIISHDIEWDIDLRNVSGLKEIVDTLSGDDRRVYRAHLILGSTTKEVLGPITRAHSPENEVDFYPDMISITVGPVYCQSLASEQPALVGWISVDISGGGYLYPWTS